MSGKVSQLLAKRGRGGLDDEEDDIVLYRDSASAVVEDTADSNVNPTDSHSDEETVEVVKAVVETKKAKRTPKFEPKMLHRTTGLPLLYNELKKIKFRGAGHEPTGGLRKTLVQFYHETGILAQSQDLQLLLRKYKEWTFQMYQPFPFDAMILKLQSLSGNKYVHSYIQSMQTYQQNGIDMMKSATDASIVPPELHDVDDELVVESVASTRSSHELADLEEEHDNRNNAAHQTTTHVSSKTTSSVINSSTSAATHSYHEDEEQFDNQEEEDNNDGYFEMSDNFESTMSAASRPEVNSSVSPNYAKTVNTEAVLRPSQPIFSTPRFVAPVLTTATRSMLLTASSVKQTIIPLHHVVPPGLTSTTTLISPPLIPYSSKITATPSLPVAPLRLASQSPAAPTFLTSVFLKTPVRSFRAPPLSGIITMTHQQPE